MYKGGENIKYKHADYSFALATSPKTSVYGRDETTFLR